MIDKFRTLYNSVNPTKFVLTALDLDSIRKGGPNLSAEHIRDVFDRMLEKMRQPYSLKYLCKRVITERMKSMESTEDVRFILAIHRLLLTLRWRVEKRDEPHSISITYGGILTALNRC